MILSGSQLEGRGSCYQMHRQKVLSPDHHMGMVEKPKTLKVPPLIEVLALAISPNMNKSIEISLTLGEYLGVIPSTNFA
jgi:hypothetical protein